MLKCIKIVVCENSCVNGFHSHKLCSIVRVDKVYAWPRREGSFILLEHQESVVSDKLGVREIPGSGNI